MALTDEQFMNALYCTSPTGPRQLQLHIEQRGWKPDPGEVTRRLADMASRQKLTTAQIQLSPGQTPVQLFSIPGHGIG